MPEVMCMNMVDTLSCAGAGPSWLYNFRASVASVLIR